MVLQDCTCKGSLLVCFRFAVLQVIVSLKDVHEVARLLAVVGLANHWLRWLW